MTLDNDDIEAIVKRLAGFIAPPIKKDYFTTEELAREFHKTRYTVSEYCRLGRISAVKDTNGKFRIPANVVEQLRKSWSLEPIKYPKTSKHYKNVIQT